MVVVVTETEILLSFSISRHTIISNSRTKDWTMLRNGYVPHLVEIINNNISRIRNIIKFQHQRLF